MVVTGVGILAFWAMFFTVGLAPENAPSCYFAYESAFPLPDAPDGGNADPLAPSPLQRALYERYRIQVPVFPWPAPPARLIRVSCERYNRPAEYEVLARALRELDPRSL